MSDIPLMIYEKKDGELRPTGEFIRVFDSQFRDLQAGKDIVRTTVKQIPCRLGRMKMTATLPDTTEHWHYHPAFSGELGQYLVGVTKGEQIINKVIKPGDGFYNS